MSHLSHRRTKGREAPYSPKRARPRFALALLALTLFLPLTQKTRAQSVPQLFIGNDFGDNTRFTVITAKQADGSIVNVVNTPTYTQFGSTHPAVPSRLAQGPDGNIYMVDGFEYTLFRFSGASGTMTNSYTIPPSSGLRGFHNVTFGLDANIYIGTTGFPTSNGIIRVNGPASESLGTSAGYFGDSKNQVYAIAFDTIGDMFASTTSAIEEYSPSGALINASFITTSVVNQTGGYIASALAIGPDANLYALDQQSGVIHKYDIVSGASLGNVSVPSGLGSLNDMAIGPDKNLYVATSGMGIARFDLKGNYLGVFIPLSATLINPLSIAFGPAFPQNFAAQLPFKESGASVWGVGNTGFANLVYAPASTWNVSGSAGGYTDIKTPDVRINLGLLGSYTIPGIDLGTFGGQVSASTNGNYGLKFTTSASGGSVDVNYPVQVTMNFPDRSTLTSGQWFNVYTTYDLASAANLSTTSPTASASLDLMLNGSFNASMNAKAFGKDVANLTMQPPAGHYNSSSFNPAPSGGNFDYGQNLLVTDTLLGSSPSVYFDLSGNQRIVTGRVTKPNIKATGAPNPSASDPRVISASGQAAFLTIQGDLSSLIRTLIQTATGGVYIPLGRDGPVFFPSVFNTYYDIADLSVIEKLNLIQDFNFAPVPRVKLQLPTGQTVNWKDKNGTLRSAVNSLEFDAGDVIQLQMPTSLTLNFTATYSLPNTFSHTLSLGVDSNLVFNPFEIQANGSSQGYSLGGIDYHPASNSTVSTNQKYTLKQVSFPLAFNTVPQQFTVSGSAQPAPSLKLAIPSQIPLVIAPYSTATTLPTSVATGTTTIIVSGSNFPANGNQAYFSIYGSAPIAVASALLNAYTLQVKLPNKYLLLAGTGQLYVIAASTGTSNSLDISVVNPIPNIKTVSPNLYAADPALTGSSANVSITDANDAKGNPTFLWGTTYYATVQSQWAASFPGSTMAATFPGYNFAAATPVPTIHFLGSDSIDNTLAAYKETPVSGKLWGSLPLTLYSRPDIAQITLVSPAPGGGTSNVLSLTINNSGPQVTGISPSVVTPGSADFTLQVTGPQNVSANSPGNFNAASTVYWDGSPLTTTFVSSDSLYAAVPAAYVATAGNHSVTVVNTVYKGAGVSSATAASLAVTLAVRYPAPTLAASAAVPPGLSPAAIVSADRAFLGTGGAATYNLTINGSGFGNGSVAQWNGTALTTQYVGPTQLAASVPYASVALPGTATITISNPTANGGGGVSNSATFTITNAKPGDTVLTALTETALTTATGTLLTGMDGSGNAATPGSLPAGGGDASVVVQGEGFYSGSVINVNGSPRATTFTAHNALSVSLLAADLASGGTLQITVTNPAPAGGTTAALPLVVIGPPPIATLAGAALDFNGTNAYEQAPAGVYFNGDFTMEGWVYFRSYNSWSRLIDFGNGGGTDDVALGLAFQSGQPFLGIHGANVYSSQALPLNVWTHLAATFSGSAATLYINGVSVGAGSLEVPANNVRQNCYIGRSNYNADAYANAQFDEIRLWSRARSQSEIQADMNASLQGNEAGLLAYWKMDEGTGATTIADATGNGHTATLNGAAWTASTAPINTIHAIPGVPRPITLSGFDLNNPALPLTFALAGAPVKGAFTGSSPTFLYTPGAAYTGAGTGSDSFTYTAISGGSAASAPATVNITASNTYAAGDGLYAQYYNGYLPAGPFDGMTPFLQTVDPTINFQGDSSGLNFNPIAWDAGVPHDYYTVRWTGKLLAPVTGNYTFTTISDDGSLLFVNGVKVVDNNNIQAPNPISSSPVALVAGQLYTIEMDFGQNNGGASAQLTWAYPGQTQQIIPQSNLFSGTAVVSGTLNFEGIAPTASAQNVAFTFRPTDGTAAFTRTLQVPASGVFAINGLPQKNYILHIKGDKYLAANVTANAAAANVTGLTAFQAAGDSNNDNSVDSTDFGILIGAFNSDRAVPGSGYDPTADFNSDGFVDSADFGLLIGEFNNRGAN